MTPQPTVDQGEVSNWVALLSSLLVGSSLVLTPWGGSHPSVDGGGSSAGGQTCHTEQGPAGAPGSLARGSSSGGEGGGDDVPNVPTSLPGPSDGAALAFCPRCRKGHRFLVMNVCAARLECHACAHGGSELLQPTREQALAGLSTRMPIIGSVGSPAVVVVPGTFNGTVEKDSHGNMWHAQATLGFSENKRRKTSTGFCATFGPSQVSKLEEVILMLRCACTLASVGDGDGGFGWG